MSVIIPVVPLKCIASSNTAGTLITLSFPVDPLNPLTSPPFPVGSSIEVAKFLYACNYTYMGVVYPNTYVGQSFNGGNLVASCTDTTCTFVPSTACIIIPPATPITAVSYTTTVMTFTITGSYVIPVNISISITGVTGFSGTYYVNTSSAGSFTILASHTSSGTIPVTSASVTVRYTNGVVSTFKPVGVITTTAASGDGTTATLTFDAQKSAPFNTGDFFTVSNLDPAVFTGIWRCTSCSTTQVQYLCNSTIQIGPQVSPGRIIGNYPFGAYPIVYAKCYDTTTVEWHFSAPLATNAFMHGSYYLGYKGLKILYAQITGASYNVNFSTTYTILHMNSTITFYSSPGVYSTGTLTGSVITNNPLGNAPPFIPGQTLGYGCYGNAV